MANFVPSTLADVMTVAEDLARENQGRTLRPKNEKKKKKGKKKAPKGGKKAPHPVLRALDKVKAAGAVRPTVSADPTAPVDVEAAPEETETEETTEEGGSKTWLYVGAGVAVLGLGAGGYFLYRRSRAS